MAEADAEEQHRHRVLVYLIAQKASVGLKAEEELKELDTIVAGATDNPEDDGTDAAHPAWWRGHDQATVATCNALADVLNRGGNLGTFADPTMQALAERITTLQRRYRELKGQARARRVPSRDALMCLIYGAIPFGSYSKTDAYELADAVLRLFAEAPPNESSPDDLRAAGWAVAVHNDYRLDGEQHTFWLFTKDGRCIKGEGRTDAAALNAARAAMTALGFQAEDGAQQRAAEPTPAVTCTWAAYAGKNKVGCDQATDHPSGMCDRHRELAESFGRDAFPEPTPWKPTVGERAVLVASPCDGDCEYLGRTGVIVERPDSWSKEPDAVELNWFAFQPDGEVPAGIHRDATWRPASAAPEKGDQLEADGGVDIDGDCPHLGLFPDGVCMSCAVRVTTLPKRAKPAEPSPRPGGFLDAVNAKLREHSERIEAVVDALKDAENALTRRVAALESRVRELDQRTIGSAK
jgi:hypothetical protein